MARAFLNAATVNEQVQRCMGYLGELAVLAGKLPKNDEDALTLKETVGKFAMVMVDFKMQADELELEAKDEILWGVSRSIYSYYLLCNRKFTPLLSEC